MLPAIERTVMALREHVEVNNKMLLILLEQLYIEQPPHSADVASSRQGPGNRLTSVEYNIKDTIDQLEYTNTLIGLLTHVIVHDDAKDAIATRRAEKVPHAYAGATVGSRLGDSARFEEEGPQDAQRYR